MGRDAEPARRFGALSENVPEFQQDEGDVDADAGPQLDRGGAVRAMRDRAGFTDEMFGFHVQQAAEKCFKAWIAMLGEEYPLTHDLGELINAIRRRDATVSEPRHLTAFNSFAVKYRYARFPENAGPIDRPAAIRQVDALMRRVRRLLSAEESRTG